MLFNNDCLMLYLDVERELPAAAWHGVAAHYLVLLVQQVVNV
jgi:hypothetical protein